LIKDDDQAMNVITMAIGSSVAFEYREDAHGVAQVMRTKEIEQPIDNGPGKPLHIHRAGGRRPIMATGNSDGDIHMLKYAVGHQGATLGLLVHHDDAEREAFCAGVGCRASGRASRMPRDASWAHVQPRRTSCRLSPISGYHAITATGCAWSSACCPMRGQSSSSAPATACTSMHAWATKKGRRSPTQGPPNTQLTWRRTNRGGTWSGRRRQPAACKYRP
jgi:hypothetical protein